MPKQTKRGKRNGKRDSGRDGLGLVGSRSGIGYPPPREANVLLRHIFRFRTDGANVDITAANLCSCLAVGYVANNSVVGLFRAVRIRKIDIWFRAPTTLAGTSTGVPSASITWTNGTTSSFAPYSEVSATAMSNSEPTHFSVIPPPNSLQNNWCHSGVGNLFTCKVPQGGLVDVTLDLMFNDGDVGTTTPCATATLGAVYAMPLDGSADALLPVGLTTTT